MRNEELKEIARQAKNELARRSLLEYNKLVHGEEFKVGIHIKFICEQVELFLNNKILKDNGKSKSILVLNIPPQHGKSQTITETLPSWHLGKYPNKRMFLLAYGDDLSRKFGRRNRDKINEYGKELFDIELKKQTETDIELSKNKGSILCRGIMGGLSGNPADLIIIDDPIKNRTEAESETYRKRLIDEYLSSITTRLSADGKIILIQTRWHEEDLAGYIIKNEAEEVHVINIPLEAEENDILGRKVGDSLFPEIGKDKEWLQKTKKRYISKHGLRLWNSLFQGKPTALEGNILKRAWWKYYTVLPKEFDKQLQSWDCTFKETKDSDFVVGQAWGKKGPNVYLLGEWRDKADFVRTLKAIREFTEKYPYTREKLIEDKANGPAVISTLKREISGIVPIEPKGSKEARAHAITGELEAGNIYLPDPSIPENEWVLDFIEELSVFPNGSNDDRVDATTQAINRLFGEESVSFY